MVSTLSRKRARARLPTEGVNPPRSTAYPQLSTVIPCCDRARSWGGVPPPQDQGKPSLHTASPAMATMSATEREVAVPTVVLARSISSVFSPSHRSYAISAKDAHLRLLFTAGICRRLGRDG